MKTTSNAKKLLGTLAFVIASLPALVACGGQVPKGDAETAPMAQDSTQSAREEDEATLCTLIPPDGVSAAFSGKLVVTGIDAADDTNCLYNLGLATGEALEGAQLIVHKVQPAMYAAEKENWEGKDNYEPLEGLGREAHLLNHAQVNVLVDDETAIRVGLMLITMGMEPPLSPEEVRAGVIELATGLTGNV
jgi:hypothetical protein